MRSCARGGWTSLWQASNAISLKLSEMYQMMALGANALLELVTLSNPPQRWAT